MMFDRLFFIYKYPPHYPNLRANTFNPSRFFFPCEVKKLPTIFAPKRVILPLKLGQTHLLIFFNKAVWLIDIDYKLLYFNNLHTKVISYKITCTVMSVKMMTENIAHLF